MDEIKQVKKSIQTQNWENMILDRQCSGLTVEQWCARENISKSVYLPHAEGASKLLRTDSGAGCRTFETGLTGRTSRQDQQ